MLRTCPLSKRSLGKALIPNTAVVDIDMRCREQAVDAIKNYKPTVVAIDGNLSPEAIQTIVKHCSANQIEGTYKSIVIVTLDTV